MADKLMIVAHPDDEVIFGGAHLLAEEGWKVVCVTNGHHKVRSREFKDVMARLNHDYDMWDVRDTFSTDFDQKDLKKRLKHLLTQTTYACVVTHGKTGEYGHPQHKIIGKMVDDLVKKNLFAFAVGYDPLPEDILNRKQSLIHMYESQIETIEELCKDDHLDMFIEHETWVRVK